MAKFLYVFSKEDRDALLYLGFNLIKADEKEKVYVFENRSDMRFEYNSVNAYPSNTLTF